MTTVEPKSTFVLENLTRHCIVASQIKAATDSATRRRGLLKVDRLDPNSGLWLNPCEAIHTFGMLISLDIVFLDAGLRVRKISEHLRPNRIAFCLAACSVLEIREGIAASTGLKCGDQLSLRPALLPPPHPIASPDFVR